MTTSPDTARMARAYIGAFEGDERPQGEERAAWIEMFADDVLWEAPLMPQPLQLKGREQTVTFLTWMMDSLLSDSWNDDVAAVWRH